MSGMESTLLRTAQNEGHVCPNPERSEGGSGGGTELYTSTSRGGIKKLVYIVLEIIPWHECYGKYPPTYSSE